MSDRELLEFAAKAAGKWGADFEIEDGSDRPVFDNDKGFRLAWGCGWWNPLADDGDALRLAVTIGLVVDCSRPSAGEPFKQHHVGQVDFQDQQAATRRAIVRAAAAIGKEMP